MKTQSSTILAAILATCLAALTPLSSGQSFNLRVAPPMEAYPPHIAESLKRHRSGTLPGSLANSVELQGAFNITKAWSAGQRLRVCFFEGGTVELRSRIARIARQWERAGNLTLDFGNISNPNMCGTGVINEIRVGYGYKGYWSLLGQDSLNFSAQTDQSMNLDYFNSNPPPEPEFSSVVLHEFGHAVGMIHEHQNPEGKCEAEFNWPEIYKYLALPPNGWDAGTVDFNMRRLLNEGEIKAVGAFDKKSIMLYRFPDWMYTKGPASPCLPGDNFSISEGDRMTFAAMYPKDPAIAQGRRDQELNRLREALKSPTLARETRERGLENLDLLSAPSSQEKKYLIERLNAPAATR